MRSAILKVVGNLRLVRVAYDNQLEAISGVNLDLWWLAYVATIISGQAAVYTATSVALFPTIDRLRGVSRVLRGGFPIASWGVLLFACGEIYHPWARLLSVCSCST